MDHINFYYLTATIMKYHYVAACTQQKQTARLRYNWTKLM